MSATAPKDPQEGLNLIMSAVLQPSASVNFPEQPSLTINQWHSDDDNEFISPTQRDPTDFNDSNIQKIKSRDTETSLAVDFFSIHYDSQLDIEKERSYIVQETDFELRANLATFSDFEKLLKNPRPMVHVSTHGQHHYKAVDKTNEFQISFEQKQTLRSLIDDDAEYSAYYAVIALLFETEIIHFVNYGQTQYQHHHKRPLRTWIWKGHTRFYLLDNGKILAMLLTNLDRFGCDYKEDKQSQCIVIYWGKYYLVEDGKKLTNVPPHPPFEECMLNTLLSNDRTVREELSKIEKKYNECLQQNETIYKNLKPFQHFSWEIMSVLLQNLLLLQGAEPDDSDDTKWNQLSQKNLLMNNNDGNGDDDESEWDNNSFFDEDFRKTTSVKYGKLQDLTREIKIIPKIEKEEYAALAGEQKKEFAKKLYEFKDRLVTLLKKEQDIDMPLAKACNTNFNVHIVRFGNQNAVNLAYQILRKQQTKPNIQEAYKIEFNPISKADVSTKRQVGYIKETEPKNYSIDIKNKKDPISKALKKHLKSKKECKIKLIVINGCHSFLLGKIFSEYVENVICIHPYVQIWDSTAICFSKYFYPALQEHSNRSKPLRQSVFEAYTYAKFMVAKECASDMTCRSHSHRHDGYYDTIHFHEHWEGLQQIIDDDEKFDQYRKQIKLLNLNDTSGPQMDVHDDKTLIISNVNKKQMEKLRLYLEQLKPDVIITKNQENEQKPPIKDQMSKPDLLSSPSVASPSQSMDDMVSKLDDLESMNRQKSSFVKQYSHTPDDHYDEFSCAYFKFKTPTHREMASKILAQKQYEESCELSQQLLLPKANGDDSKVGDDEDKPNLAWMHRKVPKCCCAPHHPHISQDKLILLQDGQIINRSMVDDLQEIREVLKKKKEREEMLQKVLISNHDQVDVDEMDGVIDDHENGNDLDQDKPLKIPFVRVTSTKNDFGVNIKSDKPGNNNFHNTFEKKQKKKSVNFASPKGSKPNKF